MKRQWVHFFIITALLCLVSCAPIGIVYTHTKRPLDTNMSRTPTSNRNEAGDLKHISFYVNVMWDSAAIGDIAKENGINTIYFADLETLRILTIWNQYTVHVYGK